MRKLAKREHKESKRAAKGVEREDRKGEREKEAKRVAFFLGYSTGGRATQQRPRLRKLHELVRGSAATAGNYADRG